MLSPLRIAVIAFLSIFSYPGTAEVLPLEYFANLPDVRNVSLSPSGLKLSSLIRIDVGQTKGTGIQVINLNTGEKKSFYSVITPNTTYWLRLVERCRMQDAGCRMQDAG